MACLSERSRISGRCLEDKEPVACGVGKEARRQGGPWVERGGAPRVEPGDLRGIVDLAVPVPIPEGNELTVLRTHVHRALRVDRRRCPRPGPADVAHEAPLTDQDSLLVASAGHPPVHGPLPHPLGSAGLGIKGVYVQRHRILLPEAHLVVAQPKTEVVEGVFRRDRHPCGQLQQHGLASLQAHRNDDRWLRALPERADCRPGVWDPPHGLHPEQPPVCEVERVDVPAGVRLEQGGWNARGHGVDLPLSFGEQGSSIREGMRHERASSGLPDEPAVARSDPIASSLNVLEHEGLSVRGELGLEVPGLHVGFELPELAAVGGVHSAHRRRSTALTRSDAGPQDYDAAVCFHVPGVSRRPLGNPLAPDLLAT
mmetsp:Transcript_87602/g.261303  ORF Transcript_87602/g.261303 Transcript_87602/m.261303 type:complete len:370 (-) Transcript_87602:515-1624(-)